MSGLLALLGGQEHTPGCESIDRALLDDTGVRSPSVAVLLAGTTPRRRAFKMAEARRYWAQFGARVRFAFTGRPDEIEHAMDVLEDPDVVVFTGGRPWLLHARLEGTPVLERVLALWRSGVPLSGSSAGAMAVCEWRHALQPRHPTLLVPGFGLVGGSVAAPHFDLYGMSRWAPWVVRRYPQLQVLGLEDRTALVGRDGEYRVLGAGSVALLRGGGTRRFGTQTRVPLGAWLDQALTRGA